MLLLLLGSAKSKDILATTSAATLVDRMEAQLTGMNKYGTRRSYSFQASPYLLLHRWISLTARWMIIAVKKTA